MMIHMYLCRIGISAASSFTRVLDHFFQTKLGFCSLFQKLSFLLRGEQAKSKAAPFHGSVECPLVATAAVAIKQQK